MTGLTNTEVKQRQAEGKVNFNDDDKSDSFLKIALRTIIDLPNVVIFLSVIFLVVFAQYSDAVLISLIVVANATISIYQEVRARALLKKLRVVRNEQVTVLRDGKEIEIDPATIVLDDVIKIKSGQYLYVDGVLLEGEGLLVDESIMTGESDYVKKEKDGLLISGSFVTSGAGFYKATKVGKDSLLNKISGSVKQYISRESPLQAGVTRLVKILIYIAFATLALLFFLNYFFIDIPNVELVRIIISIITALVPQGVILAVTISLTLGVVRMSGKKILVQNINTVETIAGINVLCMDKTGTLTENKLELIDFENFADDALAEKLIPIFCEFTLEKNKTIGAIAKKFEYKQEKVEVIEQLPFNSKIKQSGLDFKIGDKRYQLILGSLEALSPKISKDETEAFSKLEKKFSALGRRNLFFIYREVKDNNSKLTDEATNYDPLVFFSFEDRLRSNAAEIINKFKAQGIKPVIISGDSPHTLVSLIEMLKIEDLNKVISGKELAEITDEKKLEAAILEHDVFARITPEQKVQIVKAFQQKYKYVGMIGDGVNDALAIKQANLGISLGSGADATRNIADVILLNDSLISLSAIMSEGRRILFNSLRGSELLLVKNIYAVILLVVCLLAGLPFPFSVRGLFMLSFMIGNLPVILMLIDKPKNPPRLNFAKELQTFIFSGGIIAGIIGLIIFALAPGDENLLVNQTILLALFILIGMVNYLFIVPGREKLGFIDILNIKSWLIFILIGLFLICIYTPAIAGFFSLAGLSLVQWLIVLAGTLVYAIAFPLVHNLLTKPD